MLTLSSQIHKKHIHMHTHKHKVGKIEFWSQIYEDHNSSL